MAEGYSGEVTVNDGISNIPLSEVPAMPSGCSIEVDPPLPFWEWPEVEAAHHRDEDCGVGACQVCYPFGAP